MSFIKTLAVFLCCCCLLAGCRTVEEKSSDFVSTPVEVGESAVSGMQLLYSASDSLNPYTAKTELNRQLSQLLFDPLVRVDNNFVLHYCLAESIVSDQTTCTVTLRNAVFSDGSAVTAQDVLYSIEQAKASATVYAGQFYEVAAVTAQGNKTVVFTLTRQDLYFDRLLDFPILKRDSAGRTTTDSVELPPIGCGRYLVSENGENLFCNAAYYGTRATVNTIRLIHSPDAESIGHHVEIGATDLYFTDLSNGTIVRMSGKKIDLNQNYFVYLGLNGADAQLADVNVRYAISSAVNRTAVCKQAYYNNAQVATGFFHPAFADTAAVQNINSVDDAKIAIENLEKIGYNNSDADGYRTNAAGVHLKFGLLCNADNASRTAAANLIAAQLAAVGIEVTVQAVSNEEYSARLQSGDFQLYLGEVRLLGNMDFSPLVVPGGSAAYGVQPKTEVLPAETEGAEPVVQTVPTATENVLSSFYAGGCGIADVAGTLLTELPLIPICYRNGLLFYDDAVITPQSAAVGDLFSSTATGFVPD